MRLSHLLLATIALAGCRNPCQQICAEMRDYAEECGFEVDKDEFSACIDGQKKPSDGDKAFCRDFGDGETLREEWSCEDLEIYWSPGGGDPGTAGETGTSPGETGPEDSGS